MQHSTQDSAASSRFDETTFHTHMLDWPHIWNVLQQWPDLLKHPLIGSDLIALSSTLIPRNAFAIYKESSMSQLRRVASPK
jgi:hypothetical protein